MTVIRHKRGTGIPSPSDLKVGEIAIDTSTGTAYTRASDGRVVPIGGNSSGGDGGSSGPAAWDQITGKPSTFPPSAHTHQQSEVDGLEGRLNQIEDSITDGGGFIDAPDDGAQYARQSVNSKMVWSVVSGESLVHVGDDAPENPATGQLWFNTDNGTLSLFDGDDWINIGTGSKTVFTLPVSLRSGVVQLPVSEDADSLPVLLRSGEFAIPLNQSGDILAVMTRGGELELPLAA
jgi:hypothetical protein